MREYARVAPQFWTGTTGRQIRAIADELERLRTRDMASYLMTCPSSTMIGLYYLPVPTIAHERGGSVEGASETLRSLEAMGFCIYDAATDHVWVQEMARFQIGPRLAPNDNRVSGVMNLLYEVRKSCLAWPFYRYYREAYHLPEVDWLKEPQAPPAPLTSPFEARAQSAEHRAQSAESPPGGGTAAPPASGEPNGANGSNKKAPRRVVKPAAVADPNNRAAVKRWAELFEKHKGEAPIIAANDWPRLCAQIAPVVAKVGLEETGRLLELMFQSTHLKVTTSNYGLRFFAEEVNRWRGRQRTAATSRVDALNEAGEEAKRLLREMVK